VSGQTAWTGALLSLCHLYAGLLDVEVPEPSGWFSERLISSSAAGGDSHSACSCLIGALVALVLLSRSASLPVRSHSISRGSPSRAVGLLAVHHHQLRDGLR